MRVSGGVASTLKSPLRHPERVFDQADRREYFRE